MSFKHALFVNFDSIIAIVRPSLIRFSAIDYVVIYRNMSPLNAVFDNSRTKSE